MVADNATRQVTVHVPLPAPPRPWSATTYVTQSYARVSTGPVSMRRLERIETTAALAGRQPDIGADSAVLEIWEGTVQQVDRPAGVMQVVLNAKTSSLPPHTAQIELQWVAEQDLDLVQPGAVFYLTLYKQTRHGSIRNAQELRFRRRPGWSIQQLEQISRDAKTLAGKIRPRPQSP